MKLGFVEDPSFFHLIMVFPAVSEESRNACAESQGDKPCQRESRAGGKSRSQTKHKKLQTERYP